MKSLLKKILHLLFRCAVFPLVITYRISTLFQKGDSLFCAQGQLLSLIPGKIGSYLRVAYYSGALGTISRKSHIDFGTYFSHPDVVIKEEVYIGAYCILGKCELGVHTMIGSFVNILSGRRQHNYSDMTQKIQSQGGTFQRISIGNDCWIGNNTTVMADVGDRTVIGAASVVVKPIPSFSIAVGNPCRVIKRTSPPAG
jgi:acetyltransferase-like isoleucine patch superfamily enzyme